MPTATAPPPRKRTVRFEERLAQLERRFEKRVSALETAVAERDREIARLKVVVADRDREIAQLKAENTALRERVAELEARLKENSANSDRPPSSDPPWNKPPTRPREPSGRKRGGQPGHEGATRELVPLERVDKV